ncbi:hypothetical protein [Kaistia granuli]|uniref:hypothetical protein n=1 Tax=Kaistia granuli TaxID=363259 RepID=UPI0012EC2FBF|nr:hypothetical protein [Kaistia granuli]
MLDGGVGALERAWVDVGFGLAVASVVGGLGVVGVSCLVAQGLGGWFGGRVLFLGGLLRGVEGWFVVAVGLGASGLAVVGRLRGVVVRGERVGWCAVRFRLLGVLVRGRQFVAAAACGLVFGGSVVSIWAVGVGLFLVLVGGAFVGVASVGLRALLLLAGFLFPVAVVRLVVVVGVAFGACASVRCLFLLWGGVAFLVVRLCGCVFCGSPVVVLVVGGCARVVDVYLPVLLEVMGVAFGRVVWAVVAVWPGWGLVLGLALSALPALSPGFVWGLALRSCFLCSAVSLFLLGGWILRAVLLRRATAWAVGPSFLRAAVGGVARFVFCCVGGRLF